MAKKKTIHGLSKEIGKIKTELKKVNMGILSLKGEVMPFSASQIAGTPWVQTGMPWVSSEGRKAVLTEWF